MKNQNSSSNASLSQKPQNLKQSQSQNKEQKKKVLGFEDDGSVDPKNEIGFFHLKPEYQQKFRQPLYQGLVEALFPILLQYLVSSYTSQWYYFQNVFVLFFILLLKYFKCEYSNMRVPVKVIAAVYLVGMFFLYASNSNSSSSGNVKLTQSSPSFLGLSHSYLIMSMHFLLIIFGIDQFVENIPQGMTFGEVFNFMCLNAYYTCYFFESLAQSKTGNFLVGKNTYNTLTFAPVSNQIQNQRSKQWAVLNLTWVLSMLTQKLIKYHQSLHNYLTSFTFALSIVLGFIQKVQGLESIVEFLTYIFLTPRHYSIIGYMLAALVFGISVINTLNTMKDFNNLFLRKTFHILALVLFLPGTLSTPQMMTFAFNCVSVLLILIEMIRYFMKKKNEKGLILNSLDSYFKAFTDQREQQPNQLIVTHILLLMGCAMPNTIYFTILNGGFQNKYTQLVTVSSILFLGVGDTAASLIGSRYGTSKWKNNSNKTSEGTISLVVFTFIAYLMIINLIFPKYLDIFMVVLFSTIMVGFAEGLSHQYDNLVCSVLYFFLINMIHNYAIDQL
eukprot:403335466